MSVEMSANRPQLVALCAAADVTTDTPQRAVHDGVAYAVFRCEDRFYVTQDQCTHGPGSLSEGFLIGCEIECPFHQGRFDVRNGRATEAPCTEGLQTWTVHEIDGNLFIDPSERRPVEQ
jgi:nitrite reductase/ring-hydroxylating ferredoxin subunit